MQLEMNIEQLRGKKIFLATPMYGGVCHGAYTKALADLMILATKHAIDVKLYFLFNESLSHAHETTWQMNFCEVAMTICYSLIAIFILKRKMF